MRAVSLTSYGSEEGFIFLCGDDLALEVPGKLGLKDRMRQLFQKNRRDVQIAMETDTILLEPPHDAKKRQIRLRSCLMQPLHAMRPCSVVHHIGQMRVQREVQVSRGSAIRHNDLLLRIGLESSLKPG